MKNFTTILLLSFISISTFAQTETDTTSTQKETVEVQKPEFGVYDDLVDMKRRFKAYKTQQKEETAESNTPQDEYLWEAPKGEKDFKIKSLKVYTLQRPHDYAANPSNAQEVDKQKISNTIKNSLNLEKLSKKGTNENWENKLKKD